MEQNERSLRVRGKGNRSASFLYWSKSRDALEQYWPRARTSSLANASDEWRQGPHRIRCSSIFGRRLHAALRRTHLQNTFAWPTSIGTCTRIHCVTPRDAFAAIGPIFAPFTELRVHQHSPPRRNILTPPPPLMDIYDKAHPHSESSFGSGSVWNLQPLDRGERFLTSGCVKNRKQNE